VWTGWTRKQIFFLVSQNWRNFLLEVFLLQKPLAILEIVVLYEGLQVCFENLTKLECLLVNFPDVIHFSAHLQVLDEVQELSVTRVFFKRSDRNSVVYLFTERINGVVNNQDVFQLHIFEYSEIFDVNIILQNAVFAEKSVLDERAGRVQVVNHVLRIPLLG
jgi:hypothetical protein